MSPFATLLLSSGTSFSLFAQSGQREVGAILERLAVELPLVCVCLLVGWWVYSKLHESHLRHLKDKDKEIGRLVEERNHWQELVIKGRLSSNEEATKGPSQDGEETASTSGQKKARKGSQK